MSIQEFLVWLSGGVGATLVASYILERLAWFQSLSSEAKKLYKTVGSSLVALLAYLTYEYVPAEVWTSLTPYWQLVLGTIAVNYGVEVFHWFDRKVAEYPKG